MIFKKKNYRKCDTIKVTNPKFFPDFIKPFGIPNDIYQYHIIYTMRVWETGL